MAERSKWTLPRVARMAFLAGAGLAAEEIAQDDEVRSSARSVRDTARYYGLAFSERQRGNFLLDVPQSARAVLAEQASARQETPQAMMSRIARILAADPVLLANVLDDDERFRAAA